MLVTVRWEQVLLKHARFLIRFNSLMGRMERVGVSSGSISTKSPSRRLGLMRPTSPFTLSHPKCHGLTQLANEI